MARIELDVPLKRIGGTVELKTGAEVPRQRRYHFPFLRTELVALLILGRVLLHEQVHSEVLVMSCQSLEDTDID